jgi:hypothetical protein
MVPLTHPEPLTRVLLTGIERCAADRSGQEEWGEKGYMRPISPHSSPPSEPGTTA